jgi:hypothetical protein
MGFQITSFSLVVEGKWRTSTQSAEANCASADCQTLLWHGLHYSRGWSSRRSLQICFHTMCISKYSMLPASKNLVWPSRETCTRNPSWLRKFNQIEGNDNSWKGRQLKYWWLHISIQSGSRYIKLLPFLFLFLQGWHLIFEVHNLLPKLYKPMTCEIAFHIMINILLMYIYGIFQTVHQGKATLNNLTCKWNFQLFTYFKKECFIGAI